jgi:hypothetical protein
MHLSIASPQLPDPHKAGRIPTTADEIDLRQHIRNQLIQMHRIRCITSLPGSNFVGQEGFLLRHGQWFKTDDRTPSGRRMTRKQCYCNSAECALDDPTLRYCEGYCHDKRFLFQHAWVIDERGMVVDPTLRETPRAYFGVPFKTEF